MSWQEELRKLDEDLASGQLSADDYRVRRDQVLSSAVSQGDAGTSGENSQPSQPQSQPSQPQPQQDAVQSQQGGGNPGESTVIITPVNVQQSGAQQQQVTPSNSADTTQIVTGQDNSTAQTQAVPIWQVQQSHPQGQQPAQGQTQFGTGQAPAQQFQHPNSGGFAQPQHAGRWGQAEQDASPPWGNSQFPPAAPDSGSVWATQGSDSFAAQPKKGNGGKIALIVAAVVVVLGGLTVGGIFAFKGGNEDTAQRKQEPQPTQQPPPPPPKPVSPNQALLDKVPQPAGQANPSSGLVKTTELSTSGIMDAGEVEALSTRSVEEVAWRGSQKQPDAAGPTPDKFSLMVIPVGDPDTAGELGEQLRQFQTDNGFTWIQEPLPDMPPKVIFHKKVGDGPAIYRGTWVSGNNLIRVSVTQDPLTDESALSGSYQRAVKQLLENYPATE